MPFAPIFSLIVLTVGLILLSVIAWVRVLRPYVRFVVPAAVGLAVVGVFAIFFQPGWSYVLSRWRPSLFFGSPIWLEGDAVMRGLTLAFVFAVGASAMIQLSRRTSPHFLMGIAMLGMVAAALGSLWGASLLVVIVCWGWFDLFWALGMMTVKASPRRMALSGAVFLLSIAALWIGAMVLRAGGGSLYWALMAPSDLAKTLLVLAGVLRLGLYPLHLAVPVGISRSAPGAIVLYLGPVLGWGLLLRLAGSVEMTFVDWPWLEWIAIASFVAGGLMAWTRSRRSDVLPWIALASAGAVVWGAILSGDGAPAVVAGGSVAWVLGVPLISLTRGLDRSAYWWSGPPLVGALALLGAVMTPGALVTSALIGSVIASGLSLRAVAFVLGITLLTAGLARRVLAPVSPKEAEEPLVVAAKLAGFLPPVLFLFAGGTNPSLLSSVLDSFALGGLMSGGGLLGWGLWLVAVGLGAALFLFEDPIRRRGGALLGLIFDFVSLDWFLYLLLNGLGKMAEFLGTMAELIEGAGAILWAFAIFLIIALVIIGI